jgi:RHS repeat-associated protein
VSNLQSVAYPNGVTHNYTYNTRNQLTNLGVTKGAGTPTPIASYAYALDAAGHRTGVTELSGRTVSYGYDNLYRLTNETIASDLNGMNGLVSYTYDPGGNRTQKVSTLPGYPGGTSSYNANDQLATDTYDNDGNTTASNGLGYIYDFENHLLQQSGISFVYDGDGNRVAKTVAGVTTTYLVDEVNPTGYAQVIQESVTTTAGISTVAYVYGLQLLNQRRDPVGQARQISWYDYDGHGSVRALTDQNGAVTDTYDYDAFGNLIHSTGSTPNNYLFAGEQFDPDLGLYYNRARYMNMSTGRFWSMDDDEGNGYEPVSLHKYLYAGANPAGNIDPTGHDFDIGSVTFAAGEGATIGEEEDAAAISIQQTAFRTTLYAGARAFSQPTILLRAIAALTAAAVTAASVFQALSAPGELPDVAASERDNLFPIILFRDVDGTGKGEFRWRGPDRDPDGLSFFETPGRSPGKKFSVGFKAKYYGIKRDGTPGGFVEQELLGIPIIYTPNIGAGEGHWSVPVTAETASQYEEKFSEAAKRIKTEDPQRFPRL